MIADIPEKRRETRQRKKFEFMLAINNPVDKTIADDITMLIETKRFTQTIRDGVRLVQELREGRIDFLIEKFPFVVQLILAMYGATPPQSPRPVRIIEPPITEQDTRLSEPVPDDIDDVVIPAKKPKKKRVEIEDQPTWNFIIKQAIANKTLHMQDDEVIEYGLKTGNIRRSQLRNKPAPATKSSNAKPIDAPDFEDDGSFDTVLI